MNSFIEVTILLIAQTSTSSYCHLNKFQDENKTNLFDQRHGLNWQVFSEHKFLHLFIAIVVVVIMVIMITLL